MTPPRCRRMGLFAIGLLAAGCGPIEYMSQVSGRATTALADAKRAGGEQYAPYEFTAATEYLRKAREEAGHSAYQVAIEYGREAEEMATRAEAIARERSTKGSAARPPTAPPPPPTEPR